MNHDLVMINWQDACSFDSWVTLDQAKTQTLANVVSVGWVLEETDSHIVIIPNVCPENDTGFGTFAIPKPWIKKMTLLRKKRLPKS